jgi:HSP20 family molecular chaperone IbpA
MDYLYQLALEPAENPLLPEEENTGIVCQYVHTLNAEVTENDDEVTVTMDTIPGTGISKIAVALQDEKTLEINCDREEERTGDHDGNCLCERRLLSLSQVILLPGPVMKAGAKLTMKNGVLDIHLKKAQPAHRKNS